MPKARRHDVEMLASTGGDGPAVTRDARPGGWAIFLDFDGTLADIAPTPDAVVVDPDLPITLNRLRQRCDGALAIVTGRTVSVIDGFLPGLGLDVCGLHGMERRVGDVTMRLQPEHLPAFRQTIPGLVAAVTRFPGVLVEDKGESIAVHWRLAPDAAEPVRAEVAAIAAELGPAFRMQDGKALAEIVPAMSGKGRAIEALLQLPPYASRRPFFAGDDVTDENGFEAVNRLGGITLKIGAGATAARFRIRHPRDFRAFLAARAGDRDLAGLGQPGFAERV